MTDDERKVRDLVRKAVAGTCWSVAYHERELHEAYAALVPIRAMLERGQYSKAEIDIDQLTNTLDDFDEDRRASTMTFGVEYVRHLVTKHLNDIRWHEEKLREAYGHLGSAKLLLQRVNYPELNFDDINAAEKLRAMKND
jgi:hypothetical protein